MRPGRAPSRLVVNVVLPGRGVIYLGPVQLMEQRGADAEGGGVSGRSPDRIAGLLWWIAGAMVGSIGALIGILTSLGRARRLVTLAATALVVCGTLAFVVGVVALARSQPYAVLPPAAHRISRVYRAHQSDVDHSKAIRRDRAAHDARTRSRLTVLSLALESGSRPAIRSFIGGDLVAGTRTTTGRASCLPGDWRAC